MQEITNQEAYKVAARKLARLVDSLEKTVCDLCITDFNGCNVAEYFVKTYNLWRHKCAAFPRESPISSN